MRRIAPSKKRLEQVVTDLKSNYFQNARYIIVFEINYVYVIC